MYVILDQQTLSFKMKLITAGHLWGAANLNNKAFPDDTSGNKAAWVSEAVSIAASYATASTHITAGVFNRKGKCLPQELRLLYDCFSNLTLIKCFSLN